MEGNIEDLQLEELRYKHIILRNLQKTAISSIELLEDKNLTLTNEIIELKATIQTLSNNATNSNRMMINAITNNNAMKDDYRRRIQKLEEELKNKG